MVNTIYLQVMWSGHHLGPCGLLVYCRLQPLHHHRQGRRNLLPRHCGAALGQGSGRCVKPSTSSNRRLKYARIKTCSEHRRTRTAVDFGSHRGLDRHLGPIRRPVCYPWPQIPLGNIFPSMYSSQRHVAAAILSLHRLYESIVWCTLEWSSENVNRLILNFKSVRPERINNFFYVFKFSPYMNIGFPISDFHV